MGYTVFLDIIGSMIIGGIILLMMARFNSRASEFTYTYSNDLYTQQTLSNTTEIIESDFRKIGYCSSLTNIVDASKCMFSADSNSIKFSYDMTKTGKMDTVYYYLGPTSELNLTVNPRDRKLYRKINLQKASNISAGVTKFYMIYFNQDLDTLKPPIADLSQISAIELNINFESPDRNDQYMNAYYRQVKLSIQNLKNR